MGHVGLPVMIVVSDELGLMFDGSRLTDKTHD